MLRQTARISSTKCCTGTRLASVAKWTVNSPCPVNINVLASIVLHSHRTRTQAVGRYSYSNTLRGKIRESIRTRVSIEPSSHHVPPIEYEYRFAEYKYEHEPMIGDIDSSGCHSARIHCIAGSGKVADERQYSSLRGR
jgi:hypothetical protein